MAGNPLLFGSDFSLRPKQQQQDDICAACASLSDNPLPPPCRWQKHPCPHTAPREGKGGRLRSSAAATPSPGAGDAARPPQHRRSRPGVTGCRGNQLYPLLPCCRGRGAEGGVVAARPAPGAGRGGGAGAGAARAGGFKAGAGSAGNLSFAAVRPVTNLSSRRFASPRQRAPIPKRGPH